MLSPHVFYQALVIAVPVLGLVVERMVRIYLVKHLAPDGIQKAASHVILCGMLWSFVFLYRAYFSGEDTIANLAAVLLLLVTPIFTVLNLVRLARVRMPHPVKQVVALFCVLQLVGVGAYWVMTGQRLHWW